MRFLWKSQLRKERGKLLPNSSSVRNKTSRKEKLASKSGDHNSYFGVFSLWFLFLGTLLYVVFFSPYLFITATNITGAPAAEAQSLELFVNENLEGKYLWIFPKKDFFFISPRRLETKIKNAYPLVRAVTVKRIFPHSLDIQIDSREKIVLWCASSCYHIHEDGSVVPKSDVFDKEVNLSQTLMIRDISEKAIPTGASVFPRQIFPFVTSLPDAISDRLGIEIEHSFTVSSRFADEQILKTKEGWEIYLSTERPLDSSLDALGLVLEKEIIDNRTSLKYIDLRTENRIYYVFQEGTVTAGEMVLPEGEKKDGKKEAEKSKKK